MPYVGVQFIQFNCKNCWSKTKQATNNIYWPMGVNP